VDKLVVTSADIEELVKSDLVIQLKLQNIVLSRLLAEALVEITELKQERV
jgi:hypothetical protein